MTHFGLICPSASGHLNTIIPLGQELKRRGHRVTLVGVPITKTGFQTQAKTLAEGLEFQAVWQPDSVESPPEYSSQNVSQNFDFSTLLSQQREIDSQRIKIGWIPGQSVVYQEKYLTHAPAAIKSAGIEALLIDSKASAGATVAQYLDIPFVSIFSAIISHSEATVPPFDTTWSYDSSWWGILRNQIGYVYLKKTEASVLKVINYYRRKWNLPLLSSFDDDYSPLAQISQQIAELEFPRQRLPRYFHFTGPYHYSGSRSPIFFPYDKLTNQPLIYASLGSMLGGLQWVIEVMASACKDLDVQLVISRGGINNCDFPGELPKNTLLVNNAPQLELLQKATLTITHGGINTVLESLYNGLPMVAIPLFSDQHGMAARVAWAGCGEFIPLNKLTVKNLHKTLKKVLGNDSYRKRALDLQLAIKKSGGVEKAVDIIEEAISTKKPVLAR
ncbi:glycosyl transferase family protein [Planktothrix agardhii CCAP 1459/11A]|uniref:Glycosyl transferase family protein n=2 Tax=Planktothrix agardhii TaxID=1160 RepID=A0A4P5ZKA8_PLAAG|nr:glycosyl transferase family protein [Planktothrix agardhii CCAP 1459/11A]